MKNLITITLMLALSLSVAGQAVYEHSYPGRISIVDIEGQGEFYTYQFDNVLELYNKDHSFYKSIDLVNGEQGVPVGITSISSKLINTNSDIEVIYYTYDAGLKYTTYIQNEYGQTLQTFANGTGFVAEIKDDYKFLLFKGDGSSDVYDLPGTIPTSVEQKIRATSQPPFPNPATSSISLPYELNPGDEAVMEIRSIDGRWVDQVELSGSSSELMYDVSNLKPGAYTYSVIYYDRGTVTGKFVVR